MTKAAAPNGKRTMGGEERDVRKMASAAIVKQRHGLRTRRRPYRVDYRLCEGQK